jgi:hypothetical protein
MNATHAINQNGTASQTQPLGLILPGAVTPSRRVKRATGAAFCRGFMWRIDFDADCFTAPMASPPAPSDG